MMKLKVPFKVLSFRRRRPVKAYWWRRVEDFGDTLSGLQLERLQSSRLAPCWSTCR